MLETDPEQASESTNWAELPPVEKIVSNVLTDRSELVVAHAPYDSLMGTRWANKPEVEEAHPSTRSPLTN